MIDVILYVSGAIVILALVTFYVWVQRETMYYEEQACAEEIVGILEGHPMTREDLLMQLRTKYPYRSFRYKEVEATLRLLIDRCRVVAWEELDTNGGREVYGTVSQQMRHYAERAVA